MVTRCLASGAMPKAAPHDAICSAIFRLPTPPAPTELKAQPTCTTCPPHSRPAPRIAEHTRDSKATLRQMNPIWTAESTRRAIQQPKRAQLSSEDQVTAQTARWSRRALRRQHAEASSNAGTESTTVWEQSMKRRRLSGSILSGRLTEHARQRLSWRPQTRLPEQRHRQPTRPAHRTWRRQHRSALKRQYQEQRHRERSPQQARTAA